MTDHDNEALDLARLLFPKRSDTESPRPDDNPADPPDPAAEDTLHQTARNIFGKN